MSGFEIAGIVLGGFPILIEGAKLLSEHFKRVDSWWHFKREFMGFIRTLQYESIRYSQNLALFLKPVDIDPWLKAKLQNTPDSELWNHPTIQPKLVTRIDSAHVPWFWTQLIEMREALRQLSSMLSITQDGKVAFPTTRAAYELYRLKISFSSRRKGLMDKIAAINNTLDTFLIKDFHINATAASSPNSWNQAPCNEAGLPGAETLLCLQSEAKKLSCALRERWSCSCSHHQCGIRLDWNPPGAGRFEEPGLRLLFENGAVLKTAIVRSRTDGDIEPGGITSSSNIATIEQVSDLRQQARRRLEPTEVERRAEEPGLISGLVTATSLLFNAISPAESNRSSTLARSSPRRSHASLSISPEPPSRPRPPISDTCSFLQDAPTWTGEKYLKTNNQTVVFSLQSQEQPNFPNSEMKDLEEFYDTTSQLPERLEVGLEIALTILGLGLSCWIPQAWDRREVFVLKGSSIATKPFIRHESLTFTLGEIIEDPGEHTKLTMFSLGVVLLELIYQEKLEQQPFWNKHCVNGQPNEWTHQSAAMEWQLQVEARYGGNLSELIRRCVEGDFLRDPNLDDLKFLQEVVNTVASPLQRFLAGWRGI